MYEFWSIRTESRSIWVGYDDGTKATSVSQAQTHLEVLISVYYTQSRRTGISQVNYEPIRCIQEVFTAYSIVTALSYPVS